MRSPYMNRTGTPPPESISLTSRPSSWYQVPTSPRPDPSLAHRAASHTPRSASSQRRPATATPTTSGSPAPRPVKPLYSWEQCPAPTSSPKPTRSSSSSSSSVRVKSPRQPVRDEDFVSLEISLSSEEFQRLQNSRHSSSDSQGRKKKSFLVKGSGRLCHDRTNSIQSNNVDSELVTFQGPYKEPLDYPFLKKDEKSKWIDPRGFTVTGLKQEEFTRDVHLPRHISTGNTYNSTNPKFFFESLRREEGPPQSQGSSLGMLPTWKVEGRADFVAAVPVSRPGQVNRAHPLGDMSLSPSKTRSRR